MEFIFPNRIYLSGGREIDYDFDFTKKDFTIYASGNYDLELTPDFLDNQTFRIVVTPSNLLNSVDSIAHPLRLVTISMPTDRVWARTRWHQHILEEV